MTGRRGFLAECGLWVLAPVVVLLRRFRRETRVEEVRAGDIFTAEHMNGLVRQVNELTERVRELGG